MKGERLTLIEACEESAVIVSRAQDLNHLYRRAVKCYGEGELRNRVIGLALEYLDDVELSDGVFISNENMLGFCCGLWMQFLLVEFAGLTKENLGALARKVFEDFRPQRRVH